MSEPELMTDLIETTIKNRQAELVRQLADMRIYTGPGPFHQPPWTRRQRFVHRWGNRLRRVREAWLVLIGKEDIE